MERKGRSEWLPEIEVRHHHSFFDSEAGEKQKTHIYLQHIFIIFKTTIKMSKHSYTNKST